MRPRFTKICAHVSSATLVQILVFGAAHYFVSDLERSRRQALEIRRMRGNIASLSITWGDESNLKLELLR